MGRGIGRKPAVIWSAALLAGLILIGWSQWHILRPLLSALGQAVGLQRRDTIFRDYLSTWAKMFGLIVGGGLTLTGLAGLVHLWRIRRKSSAAADQDEPN